MTVHHSQTPQFFLTSPSPCPYLPGRAERKVFTHLVGEGAAPLLDLLSQGGFRRSQNIAYRPACEQCQACISVRILVDEFKPGRNMRKILAKNADLRVASEIATPSSEQFSLFRDYLDNRHLSGGMTDMTALDYAMMVEDSPVDTRIIEYRAPSPAGLEQPGELLAVALTDFMSDGLSMVYSFFETEAAERSLGTYMILDHIEKTRRLGLPYLYLGYWVEGSRKMDYKIRFQPQEHLAATGWVRYQSKD